ncbi:MAG TPA: hypothetical protein VMM60_16835 [Ilumatobacter sp.]|nr:hypothetical protein [Ilumatobacter sp.]
MGNGVVGQRLRRFLGDRPVISHQPRWADITAVSPGDVVVLAHGAAHAPFLPRVLERGAHAVTVGDTLDDVAELLAFDTTAIERGVTVVAGAALAPGLSGLIARHLACQLHVVDEIHVASHGTAGPACARDHHQSLRGWAPGWHDNEWVDSFCGSGRELCWFPEPIGALDCYRARTASPLLLHRSFPNVSRISARRSARRRDRLTAGLPMLASPHQEGGVGALRVELRGGAADGSRVCVIAGIAELVGTASAATAAAFATLLVDEGLPTGVVAAGDESLPNTELLHRVASFGVRLQEFTGVPQPT